MNGSESKNCTVSDEWPWTAAAPWSCRCPSQSEALVPLIDYASWLPAAWRACSGLRACSSGCRSPLAARLPSRQPWPLGRALAAMWSRRRWQARRLAEMRWWPRLLRLHLCSQARCAVKRSSKSCQHHEWRIRHCQWPPTTPTHRAASPPAVAEAPSSSAASYAVDASQTYAVVEIGGHQLIVEEGRWYAVNRLEVRAA